MFRLLPFLSAFLMWAAFKPLGVGPLIFLAILCWLLLIASKKELPKHSYKWIYGGSALAWLALLQGIRLAYWPLYFGWIALSLYVAIYIPLFVFISRFLVHRWRWPIFIAAPLVWSGCELLRCYVMTGFGGCLLCHAMVDYPALIQLASHVGPQLLSGLFVFFSSVLFVPLQNTQSVQLFLRPIPGQLRVFSDKLDVEEQEVTEADSLSKFDAISFSAQVLVMLLAIGGSVLMYRQGQSIESEAKPLLQVALIQENAETRFEYSQSRAEKSWERYFQLTGDTADKHQGLDLIVWPESIFTPSDGYFDWDGKRMPEEFAEYVGDPRTAYENARFFQRFSRQRLEWLQLTGVGQKNVLGLDTPIQDPADASIANLPALLLGVTRHKVRESGFVRYNSTVFKAKGAGDVSFYDKRKLVMFGEYIPFAKNWPTIYRELGMSELGVGQEWQAFEVDGVKIAPSICFEDMLPQAMQSQTASLIRKNNAPDVLVNVTNDGWFRGSSMLDHHFACAVFTAVENRRPMLVSANTGISTWVTGNGKVMAKSQKLSAEAIVAEPTADGRWGLWQVVGDWPARLCAVLIAVALAVMSWKTQVKQYSVRRRALTANAKPS